MGSKSHRTYGPRAFPWPPVPHVVRDNGAIRDDFVPCGSVFLVHSSFLYAIVGWRPGGTFPFLQAQDEHVCIFGTMPAEKRPYGSLSADKVVLCLHSRKSARPAPLPPANSRGAHHHKVQKCPFRATSFRTVLAGNGVNYMGMTQTNSEGVYGCTSLL